MPKKSIWRKLLHSVQSSDSSELPRQVTRMILSRKYPQVGRAIGGFGGKPNFLIIGTQKGGTTSLYNYMAEHPKISAGAVKEIHYFDISYSCGDNWYRAHFAPEWWLKLQGKLTGEASPYYLFAPASAARAASFSPDLKIIVLLRQPVYRAYSHYNMSVRSRMETCSFAEALELEVDRLQLERDTLGEELAYVKGKSHRHHSYASRGRYAEQLMTWFEHFPRDQFLILESEEFFTAPARVYKHVQKFLGLPHHELSAYRALNDGSYEQIDPKVRERLEAYFAPHNARLEELLGRKFWSTSV